eukprot:1418860-Amphidinium_carterae.1
MVAVTSCWWCNFVVIVERHPMVGKGVDYGKVKTSNGSIGFSKREHDLRRMMSEWLNNLLSCTRCVPVAQLACVADV